jgi:hypothetical protein
MIVKVTFIGSQEYYSPIVDQMEFNYPKELNWMLQKLKTCRPIRMDLDEAIRLFTVLNSIEKIYFEMGKKSS